MICVARNTVFLFAALICGFAPLRAVSPPAPPSPRRQDAEASSSARQSPDRGLRIADSDAAGPIPKSEIRNPKSDYYPFRGLDDPTGRLEALAEQCKQNPTPELLTTTGWLFHIYGADQRHNQKARQLFETALDSEPENAWARYGLCLVDEIKGDFDSVLSNSLILCESSPAHPLGLLALLNVRSLFGQLAHFNEPVETALRTLLEENRSGSVQFDEICREILSAISRGKGDAEEVMRLVGEGGYVTEWRIVGPFGEFPNLSFLSKWQPESDRALNSRYRNDDRVLKSRHYSSEYGWLRPRWLKRGVYYAEVFLRSRSSKEVVLRISSRSAVELFLNNHRIYTKDTIRSYPPITEYVKASLSPGYNRLLLKFLVGGQSLYTNVSYKSLRYGCIMPELATMSPSVQILRCPHGAAAFSLSASPHRWQGVKRVEHSEYEPSALSYFSALSRENPNDPLAPGLCGILKSVQGDARSARRSLLAAVKRVPSYCYFNYVLGVVVGNDPALPGQIRQSEAGARFRSALAAAGTFPRALYHTALLDMQQDKDLDAIEKLNRCVAQSPALLSWHESLYRLYQRKGWQNEQRRELDTILSLGVESCRPYHLAEGYYRSTKQYDKLAETIENLQRTHLHPEFLARHCYQTGRDSEAIAEYLKLKAAQPEKESIHRSLISLYERNGRWVQAERELKDTLKLFPKDLSFWKRLARLKGYTGHRWTERRLWNRVLRQDPVDADARGALRTYGQKDMLDELDIPSSSYIHDESLREKYAGVSSAIIIDQAVEEIYPNCSSRQKTHQLILLNDKKAIDKWGELNVPDDELLQLRTIKRDGTVVEPERPPGSKGTISMSGLQEGDFIEYEYITTTSVFRDSPRRFLGQRFFFQSVELPMEISQYVLIAPENMRLDFEQVSSAPHPSVIRRGRKKIYKWEARGVPAVPNEPLAAPDTEFLPFVRVGVSYDEDAEILRYQDHNVAMTKTTDEIREITAAVLSDCSPDAESRARAIYSFVNKEVRGAGGSSYLTRSASETLADKRGDRLSLAKAMLDIAGVESRMLVVRGKLAHVSKVFPGSFSSALLAIRGSDGRYTHFLDFSSRYFPFGYINSVSQGGSAIPLQDFSSSDFGLGERKKKFFSSNGVQRPVKVQYRWQGVRDSNNHERRRNLLTLPSLPSVNNCEQRSLNASIARDGSIEGTQAHEYTGDGGAALRNSMVTAQAYEITHFIETMANASFRAAALTDHKVVNLSDSEKPLLVEYGFRAPKFARVVGKEMVLDQWLPLLRFGARFASLEARKSPLQISGDSSLRFQAVLKLPSGAKAGTIPSPVGLESDFGFYHLRVAELDGAIRVEADSHLKAQRILPQDYPRFVDFCRAVDAAERKELRIRLEP